MSSRGEAKKIFNSSLNTEDAGRRNLLRLARAARRLKELVEMERCRIDPLYWLQTWTETFDEKWKEKGLQSPYRTFPRKPYFPFLFYQFQTERRLFVPKSRDMMISWAAIGFAVWKCQFVERQHVIVQAQKEGQGCRTHQRSWKSWLFCHILRTPA